MARFYSLAIVPTLFGEWSLLTEWGRIGQGGPMRRRHFQDEPAATQALAERVRQKMKRGYRLVGTP
jgi:predicted DNA-binding WGR domain protein